MNFWTLKNKLIFVSIETFPTPQSNHLRRVPLPAPDHAAPSKEAAEYLLVMLIFDYNTQNNIQSSSSEDEMIASTSYYDIRDLIKGATETAHTSTEKAVSSTQNASLSTEKASLSSEMVSSLSNSSECLASDVQMLREVLPNIDRQKISDTLVASGMDLEKAINKILSESASEEAEHSHEDDTDDPELAVNPFGQELDMCLDRNKDILEQAVRKYKHPSFDTTRPLNVAFQDEPGVDAGGVTREYFSLLMQRLENQTGTLKLFEGTRGHLVPMHNYYLSGGLFVMVGKMILHASLNKCNGMAGLSQAAVTYIISGSCNAVVEHIVLDDIPDPVMWA
ncbi:E3 ubiquitin- ligase UPL2-like [Paramuricea clavata]|uniref:E3 ubiquitin- ligase UPL2-like n=1 Tax=Paramuricea clavata TaxID=317549 RepID=A0A6S7HL07_PARCT|nr:E3 ubiquitin- ligase UPL2-like [Paramuricea clavata]